MVILFNAPSAQITNKSISPLTQLNNGNYEITQLQKNVNQSITDIEKAIGGLSNNVCFIGLNPTSATQIQNPNSILILNTPIYDPYSCFKDSKFISPITGLIGFDVNIHCSSVTSPVFISAMINHTTFVSSNSYPLFSNSNPGSISQICFHWTYNAQKGDTFSMYYTGSSNISFSSSVAQITMSWR